MIVPIIPVNYRTANEASLISHYKGIGSPYSIIDRRVPELIPVLGSQPAVCR